jgi:hypothetical protein
MTGCGIPFKTKKSEFSRSKKRGRSSAVLRDFPIAPLNHALISDGVFHPPISFYPLKAVPPARNQRKKTTSGVSLGHFLKGFLRSVIFKKHRSFLTGSFLQNGIRRLKNQYYKLYHQVITNLKTGRYYH